MVGRAPLTEWRAEHEARLAKYRADVRKTFQRFSDEALAFQSARIVGGIDREECDREIERRSRG